MPFYNDTKKLILDNAITFLFSFSQTLGKSNRLSKHTDFCSS